MNMDNNKKQPDAESHVPGAFHASDFVARIVAHLKKIGQLKDGAEQFRS